MRRNPLLVGRRSEGEIIVLPRRPSQQQLSHLERFTGMNTRGVKSFVEAVTFTSDLITFGDFWLQMI